MDGSSGNTDRGGSSDAKSGGCRRAEHVGSDRVLDDVAPLAPPLAVDQSLLVIGASGPGGWVEGPRIKGKLVGPVGDWLRVMPSGVLRQDVRGTIQTDTNDLIFMSYNSAIQCSKEQLDRLNAGEELKTGDCYFITAPTFETKSEKYGWINAVQAVGKMTSLKFGDHLDYDIFAVK
jgi:hypothetical protein